MSKIQYRKRVPTVLQSILNRKEFRLLFETQNEVDHLNALIENSLLIIHSKLDDESKHNLITNSMKQYIKKDKHSNDTTISLSDAIDLYLKWSKNNVHQDEYKTRENFFTLLLPKLFIFLRIPINDVSKITATHLYKLSNKISKLPNRRLYKYRILKLDAYVNLEVDNDEYLLPDTANKLIKRIRGLSNYGAMTGLYTMPNSIPTIKQGQDKSKTSFQRNNLTKQEITTLFSKLPHKAKLLSMIVYYSGLRPSEIHKCSISTIDDILCFDLLNPTSSLKTSSSYRLVPIHPKLLPYVVEISQLTYSSIRATSSRINKHIKEHLQDTNKKSLYSLRHSFITHLINAKVSPEIVSELAGHSHNTMTMQRYFKGYDISTLQKVVEIL